jgi:acyl carrier protein
MTIDINNPKDISDLCVRIVAGILERQPEQIDPATRFSRLGLDSAMSVQLVVTLEQELDLQLLPDLVAEHPTILKLSAKLAELCAARTSRA